MIWKDFNPRQILLVTIDAVTREVVGISLPLIDVDISHDELKDYPNTLDAVYFILDNEAYDKIIREEPGATFRAEMQLSPEATWFILDALDRDTEAMLEEVPVPLPIPLPRL